MATLITPPRPDDTTPPQRKGSDGDVVPVLLRPFVDFVAHIQARLETKFLAGFLVISLLMLALGIGSLLVVNRLDSQVQQLSALEAQMNNAQDMLYNITSQSHFRTMALLTGEPVWDDKLAAAKERFTTLVTETEAIAIGDHRILFAELTAINIGYDEAGQRVTSLQESNDIEGALQVHIQSEHEISHDLEDLINAFIIDTEAAIAVELDDFSGVRSFLTVALAIFSAMSLAGALALGAIISWTVIRPVRKIDDALHTLANGDFTVRVDVPNRDEFGKLSANVNRASEQLETLYGRLETVNRDLQAKVDEQVAELRHASQLRRYLSPMVADSIVSGERGFGESRRAELSIAFIDIRGFTALSEQSEPEEMATSLNMFLTDMTDIVFRHGGTLDKYLGDAVMVFFNDPLPQEDHASRAVAMALDMQTELGTLRQRLTHAAMVEITAGIGISTGFVTVGNFGSPNRMDYTVMGNHVNLASRLSGDAGPGEILISERTLALLPEDMVEAEPAGSRNLKGVRRPIRLYRVWRRTV